MKKSFYLIPAAALALASCANDDPVINGDGTIAEPQYLAISLASNSITRAAGDQTDNQEPNGNSSYEMGQEAENLVNNVRFFFFDASGNPVAVKSGNSTNWMDFAPQTAENGENKPNIEKALEAMIILDSKEDIQPASIIAVLNHPFDATQGMVSKSELTSLHGDYSSTSGFIMSNSVYKNAAGQVAVEVPVQGHLYSAPEAAKNNPVTIYVERVLAKMRVNFNLSDGNGTLLADDIYKPKTSQGAGQFNGKDLCVRVLGWNVTNTTNDSYLVKNIDPNWADNLFGASESWNYAPFFRSFWAINPTLTAISSYNYGNFAALENGAPVAGEGSAFSKLLGEYTYMQENAADLTSWNGISTKRPTQVIIAAQLGTYENGTFQPVTMAEWAFNRYSVDDLKTAMLAINNRFYRKVVNPDNSISFRQISAADLTFKTAMTVNPTLDWTGSGRYYVYCQLTDEAAAAEWHTSNAEGNTNVISAANINRSFVDMGHAKIWNNGYTYYYFDIRHLSDQLAADGKDAGGYYGVVRNHLYDAVIKSLVGLGTPVYDPSEVIYPEKPEDEDTYIAADIKILSWRLVKQDINLEW